MVIKYWAGCGQSLSYHMWSWKFSCRVWPKFTILYVVLESLQLTKFKMVPFIPSLSLEWKVFSRYLMVYECFKILMILMIKVELMMIMMMC